MHPAPWWQPSILQLLSCHVICLIVCRCTQAFKPLLPNGSSRELPWLAMADVHVSTAAGWLARTCTALSVMPALCSVSCCAAQQLVHEAAGGCTCHLQLHQ